MKATFGDLFPQNEKVGRNDDLIHVQCLQYLPAVYKGQAWPSMKHKDAIKGRDWAFKGIVVSQSKLLLLISNLVARSAPYWVKVSYWRKALKFKFEGEKMINS